MHMHSYIYTHTYTCIIIQEPSCGYTYMRINIHINTYIQYTYIIIQEQNHEGCLVHGTLEVNKVAGNFHFAPGKSLHQVYILVCACVCVCVCVFLYSLVCHAQYVLLGMLRAACMNERTLFQFLYFDVRTRENSISFFTSITYACAHTRYLSLCACVRVRVRVCMCLCVFCVCVCVCVMYVSLCMTLIICY